MSSAQSDQTTIGGMNNNSDESLATLCDNPSGNATHDNGTTANDSIVRTELSAQGVIDDLCATLGRATDQLNTAQHALFLLKAQYDQDKAHLTQALSDSVNTGRAARVTLFDKEICVSPDATRVFSWRR